MVTILMIPAKLATLGLLSIRLFGNKSYGVIITVHDVSNRVLSRESNHIVDMVMWPKSGNSSMSMTEVIITSI